MAKRKGFFNAFALKGETGIKKKTRGIKKNTDFKPGDPLCHNCGLNKTCKSPVMPTGGEGKKGILFIAEAPGATEDVENTQLVGKAGTLLNSYTKKVNFDIHTDAYKENALACRPPKNNTPTPNELSFCKPRLLRVIEEKKPKAIILLGESALKSYFMGKLNSPELKEWVGMHWPDVENNCWVFSVYHPSWALRNEGNYLAESEFSRQITRAITLSQRLPEVPKLDAEPHCHPLYEFEEVIELLDRILKEKPKIYPDFETTGIKPFNNGHRLETIGFGFGGEAWAYPYMRQGYWTEEQFKKIQLKTKLIFRSKQIKKVCHNTKFESLWTKVKIGVEAEGMEACTMLQAHVLDSRGKIKSLKRQVFLKFGILDYDSEISHFLESDDGQGFNKIDEAPLDRLLLYNAEDCFFTEQLDIEQNKQLDKDPLLNRGRKFLFESGQTLYKVQMNGITSDLDYYKRKHKELTEEIEHLEESIHESEEAKFFLSKTGKRINYNSPDDLRLLLFNLMGIKSTKETNKGGQSTDAEVLGDIDIPFTKHILKIKKLLKARDTYVINFIKETNDDSKIHPFFNLHTTRTYRSSGSNPNWQNIPVRDEEIKELCRRGIIASPGFRMSESDYGSQEVRIAACYTEDPVLIDYINDPSTDMHRDEAQSLFLLNDKQWTKALRFYAKNGWVFPQFYGSYYVSCANNLWHLIEGLETAEGQDIKEHLAEKGLWTYERFEQHCKLVEKKFWTKFRFFKQWQKRMLKTYQEKGYVEMFFGFRRYGYLPRNKIFNTSIQGTAFHALMWSMNRVQERLEAEKWNTRLIGQIHDSIIADNDPAETNSYLNLVIQTATIDIRKEFSEIIVPLIIEPELTPINGSWYEKEEVAWDKSGYWVGVKSKKAYTPEY